MDRKEANSMSLTELYDWLQGDGLAAQNPKPALTAEAIQSHPVNAVTLPLPEDATPALLKQAHDAALGVYEAADNAISRILGGEDFGYWAEGGPDAHEYFEPINTAALDRLEALDDRLPAREPAGPQEPAPAGATLAAAPFRALAHPSPVTMPHAQDIDAERRAALLPSFPDLKLNQETRARDYDSGREM